VRLLPNHDIQCCDPNCDAYGITSVNCDLPPGWTFRLVPGREDDNVLMLCYCPDCSREHYGIPE